MPDRSDSQTLLTPVVKRRGRRIALVAMYPEPDPAMPEFISNHGLRMVEATLRASELEGMEVVVFDLHDATADELYDALLDVDPDVVVSTIMRGRALTSAKTRPR